MNQLLTEQLDTIRNRMGIGTTVTAFHGTRTTLPFKEFDPKMIGTGIVSNGGNKYPGFFFTTEKENAEFYTEWFIATVSISDVKPNPTTSTHPPTVLKTAAANNEIYMLSDVYDGAMHSDIVVVPVSRVNNVKILGWEFVGDEQSIFDSYDDFFAAGGDEEEPITQDLIGSLLSMIHMDLKYLLTIDVFRKYYESKSEY